jgi:hypothetical protein
VPTPSTDTARHPRRDHRTPLLTAPPDPSQSHRPVSPPSPGRSSPAAPSSRAPSPRPRLRPRLRSPSASSHRRRTSPCRTPTSPSATSTRAKWCVIPPSRAFFTTQTVPRAGASGENAIAGRAAGRLRAGTACFVSWSTPAQTLRPQVCFSRVRLFLSKRRRVGARGVRRRTPRRVGTVGTRPTNHSTERGATRPATRSPTARQPRMVTNRPHVNRRPFRIRNNLAFRFREQRHPR